MPNDDKQTGVIDPPVSLFSSKEQLLAWKKTLEGMPDTPQKVLCLDEVDYLLKHRE